jgi:hypothetical protein
MLLDGISEPDARRKVLEAGMMEKDPIRSAAGRKSRRKGKVRENEIAKAISLWWTGGKDNKVFRRAPLSGGFPNKRAHGDILPMKPEAAGFPFLVDVKDRKNVESLDFVDLLLNEKCPVFRWFDELTRILQENPIHGGKLRLLIIHKNRRDYCVVGQKEISEIEEKSGAIHYIKVKHPFRWEMLYIFPLKMLFDKNPDTFKSIAVPHESDRAI